MARSRKYPQELRERAVRTELESGRPIAQVAKDLGVGAESLRAWVRQAQADAGERTQQLTTLEGEELKRLRGEMLGAVQFRHARADLDRHRGVGYERRSR